HKPRSYFKKGRAFMMLWTEPTASSGSERTIYYKIRRFVVIRQKSTHCLCLPINTYSGQGITKRGIYVQDHAAVVSAGGEGQLIEREQELTKSSLYIKTEDPSISIDSASLIKFGKVYTVEYNLKVKNIGRILPASISHLESYVVDTLKLSSTIESSRT
ncbi:hypothetical protein BDV95DRAFT_502078, partial [Massariosphaeria phaeospora]